MALDQKLLKGDVSGKNTGKKILSRTLSGVGTIAAYVVGGSGGLNGTITGETLLRDRPEEVANVLPFANFRRKPPPRINGLQAFQRDPF